MKKKLNLENGAATMLLPIIVLPVIAIAYLTYIPINDVNLGKYDSNAIIMEYENQVESQPQPKINPDDSVPRGNYKGYKTIGTFRIPSISLNQKVLDSVSADGIENTCAYLYSNNGFNQVGNTVIIGHNYRNGKLFSNLTKLKNGDMLYLKTNGQKSEVKYKVYKRFITSSFDASFYNRDTSGKRELTLSTCSDDVEVTDNRLIILAREE